MIPLKKALTSSIGKKYVMGVTGLALVGFMVTHLFANLWLYWPDPDAFNYYPYLLHSWGAWLTVAELALAGLFVVHASMAVWLWREKEKSRGGYAAARKTKGGNSRFNLSSNNMIISGGVLLVFLIIHVWQFRFGPGLESSYVTEFDGEQSRDLYTLVYDVFQDPVYVVFYVAVMLFLGLHVRHGFWSAFQSLGAMKPEWSKGIYSIGLAIALIFSVGFLFIPIWIYFDLNLFAR